MLNKTNINIYYFFIFILISLLSCNACKQAIVVNNRYNAYKLFDTSSEFLFDRLATKTSARIKFKTLKPTICELKLWTQSDNIEPTQISPRIIPCLNTTPQTDFVEYLSNLHVNVLYSVEITVKNPLNDNEQESIIITETPPTIDKELFWAKINIPLKTAEILKAVNTNIKNSEQIKSYFMPSKGCYNGYFKHTSFVKNISDTGIDELITKGFLAGVASFNIEHPQYMRFNYTNQNNTSKWEWIFSIAKQQYSFISNNGSVFLSVKLEQDSKSYTLESSHLIYPDYPLNIGSDKEIKLHWSYNSLSQYSYVLVQVNSYNYENAFYCIFDAQAASGIINPKWTNQLNKNTKYDLTISLLSTQIKAFPETEQATWLITTTDWKTTRIQRI